MCQEIPQLLDQVPVAYVAVMWMMQEDFGAVQLDMESCPVRRIDRGAKMIQERLDLAPMNVGADGIVKDTAQQVGMLVTHLARPW